MTFIKIEIEIQSQRRSTIFKRECIRRPVSHISYLDQRIVIFTGSREKSMRFIKHPWYFLILSRILKLRICNQIIKNISSVNYLFFSSLSLNNYYRKSLIVFVFFIYISFSKSIILRIFKKIKIHYKNVILIQILIFCYWFYYFLWYFTCIIINQYIVIFFVFLIFMLNIIIIFLINDHLLKIINIYINF